MTEEAGKNKSRKGTPPEREPSSGVHLSLGQIEEYLKKLEASGCSPATAKSYRRSLKRLYQFLGEDKTIREETIALWQEYLLKSGYRTKTVNVFTSAANGLMAALGYRRFQTERVKGEESIQPELTRNEYLRLLSAAKRLDKEKAYLLVKLFATTGISVNSVNCVTAEAVRDGKITFPSGNVRIPDSFKKELLHFMGEQGIAAGPVFMARTGKLLDRTVMNSMIKSLCRDAQVPEKKANPRCLRKLYQSTQAGIADNYFLLIEQAYDRLLEKEQDTIGWDI